jgi:TolB-like protein
MELRRIAVRYFDDLSGDGAYGHLAEGLTEDLIDRLSRIRTLHVVSGNGVAPFRGSNDVGADSVARAVQAGTVVHGSLDVAGERMGISFRLLDGESGAEIRRASLEGAFPELLTLQEELARQVAVSLEEWLGEAVELRRREDESAGRCVASNSRGVAARIRTRRRMCEASDRPARAYATKRHARCAACRIEQPRAGAARARKGAARFEERDHDPHARTRLRITEAAGTIGPARTTLSAVAERAGATPYRLSPLRYRIRALSCVLSTLLRGEPVALGLALTCVKHGTMFVTCLR